MPGTLLTRIAAITLLAVPAACAGSPLPPAGPTASEAAAETGLAGCSLLASGDWQAWIDRMPGVGMEPDVHVTGQVTTRSGGYTFTWKEGPLDRSTMPVLRLELVPVAPEGPAIQAITTQEVSYSRPVGGLTYRGVLISCGQEILAEIPSVEDVY